MRDAGRRSGVAPPDGKTLMSGCAVRGAAAGMDPTEQGRETYRSRPVVAIDVASPRTIAQLVEAYGRASIQGRNLARCVAVYRAMLADPARPVIFLGLSGPLIAAGLRKVLADMIRNGLVDVVVTTGAIAYQDLYQSRGGAHYAVAPDADDVALRRAGLDRIYDTVVDDALVDATDRALADFAAALEPRAYSTREFLGVVGARMGDEASILRAAADCGVPVFCPAIADSSIGIGLTLHHERSRAAGGARQGPTFSIDTIRDNYEAVQIVRTAGRTGAVFVGGGVPKNWINDAVTSTGLTKDPSASSRSGHAYAIQITTDAPHWGGLSGSTLEEARSWGKVAPDAPRATVYSDATIALPLVVGALLEHGDARGRRRHRCRWEGDRLAGLE